MRTHLRAVALSMIFTAALCANANAAESGLQLGMQAFAEDVEKNPPQILATGLDLSGRFDTEFGALLEAGRLRTLDDETLRTLFATTGTMVFYTVLIEHSAQMQSAFAEMRARGIARAEDYRNLHGTLLQLRQFDAARQLDDSYDGDLGQATPAVSFAPNLPGHVPKWLTFDGSELRVEEASPQVGRKVVVISSPFCYFSNLAMKAIEEDPALKARFKTSMWVAPQERHMALDLYRTWNEDHADVAPMHLMFNQWDWPLPNASTTPTFYFLDQGKVVAVVQGWPGDVQKEALIAAFSKLGD